MGPRNPSKGGEKAIKKHSMTLDSGTLLELSSQGHGLGQNPEPMQGVHLWAGSMVTRSTSHTRHTPM